MNSENIANRRHPQDRAATVIVGNGERRIAISPAAYTAIAGKQPDGGVERSLDGRVVVWLSKLLADALTRSARAVP